MSTEKWLVQRTRRREQAWYALPPEVDDFDSAHKFPTHAEALAFAVSQTAPVGTRGEETT